jgi:LCP family protein required for cell wall assembly
MEPAVAPTRATASSGPPGKNGNRGGKSTKRGKRRDPLWARLLVVAGAVLMVTSGGLIVGSKALISNATSTIEQENLLGDAGKTKAEGGKDLKGPIDLLMLGVDVRGSWDHNDTRADTIIILHIPATHDQAYLVSIPRDTSVKIPAFPKSKYKGGTDKINSAFFFGAQNGGGWAGGAQLMAQTIKKMTGVSFDGAAIIDFNGFKGVIDALGTIRMCVDQKVESHHMMMVRGKPMWNADAKKVGNGRWPPVVHKVGCREMEGWEALDYSRQRYGLKNGDYDRQQHQQQLIKAMAKKAMDGGVLTNPLKLNSLMKAAGKAFTLDTGGTKIEDFVFTMRNVTANEMVLLRTNNGTFSEQDGREVLRPISQEMFAAVKSDTLADFVLANPTVVSAEKK